MKTVSRKKVNQMLRDHFVDNYGGLTGAAVHYGVSPQYISKILSGAKPRDDMLKEIGCERELVKTERFYKVEGDR